MPSTSSEPTAARVLLIGTGGHAKVCAEALHDTGHTVVGCVNRDGGAAHGMPAPVVGRDSDLAAAAAACGADAAFVAVGDNPAREVLAEGCAAAGLPLVTAISRFAMVSSSARLAPGVLVAAGAVVNAAAAVADGVILNTRSSVDHDCTIGAFAHVAVGATLAGAVVVGQRALLGAGCAVLPQVHIGHDATVGAGAVVRHDVAPGSTVVGVPARAREPR